MRPWHLTRRARSCAAVVFVAAAVVAVSPATAQRSEPEYPGRPIRVIVPVAPGGGVDIMARTIAPLLAGRIGQSVVVDNRAGGGGSIGAELTARAAADGYTIMLASSAFVLHSLLYPARYDPLRDFAPVTEVVQHPYVLLVGASVPAANARGVDGSRDMVESDDVHVRGTMGAPA